MGRGALHLLRPRDRLPPADRPPEAQRSGSRRATARRRIVEKIERSSSSSARTSGRSCRASGTSSRSIRAIPPSSPWTPSSAAGEIFDALRRLTVRAAQVRPRSCVFEDLHWMDQATEEYLALGRPTASPTSRVLLVLTYRPGYAPSVRRADLSHADRPRRALRRGQRPDGRGGPGRRGAAGGAARR